jgi:aspartyl protease family protein
MAGSPITWSLSIAGVTGLLALNYAESLDRLTRRSGEGGTAMALRPTQSGGAAAPSGVLALDPDRRGHYTVHPQIDGARITMMVDTGASFVALTDEDARRLGVRPPSSAYSLELGTANGVVRAARVTLRDVRLADILVRDVEAVVLPAGALSVSLLGTSFLRRLSGYEVRGGRMILRG